MSGRNGGGGKNNTIVPTDAQTASQTPHRFKPKVLPSETKTIEVDKRHMFKQSVHPYPHPASAISKEPATSTMRVIGVDQVTYTMRGGTYTVHEGPRGGRYIIVNKKKVYIKHS